MPNTSGDNSDLPGDSLLAEDVLASRTPAPRDPSRESEALDRLIGRINKAPHDGLQALVETALDLCGAGSAGTSLLNGEDFYWPAIAGAWAPFAGSGIPIDASPCGVVIRHERPFLFDRPERAFAYDPAAPQIHEALLVPLYLGERPVGTLWLLSHDDRRFDAEDVRILERLALFESSIEQARRLRADGQAISALRERVRHTIAMVRAILRRAAMQARGEEAEQIVAELGSRVLAYADAARLTSPDRPADLGMLLLEVLARSGEASDDRVMLDGPDVGISPDQAGILGLAFHELFDNAVRHGSLKVPGGRVEVSWSVEEEDGAGYLRLRLEELGAISWVKDPVSGFGFDLLKAGLPDTLGAGTTIENGRMGLRFTLRLPLGEGG